MPLISTIRSELDRILFPNEPSQKKSIELVIGLLDHATQPFDRATFHPGHLTASWSAVPPGWEDLDEWIREQQEWLDLMF